MAPQLQRDGHRSNGGDHLVAAGGETTASDLLDLPPKLLWR